MSGRSLFKLVLVSMAGIVLCISPTQAQTCYGTLVLASADYSTGPGQIFGGTYLDTQASNNVGEAFNETLSNGVSRLYHAWRFDNVPAGAVHIIREGYRLTCDSDDFRFRAYYDTGSGPFFIFGNFCTITSTTESSAKCSFNHTTTDAATFYVNIQDTGQSSGTDLSAVRIDYLALCIEDVPCVPPPGGYCQ
jgi:hypothetical protein